ncbi:putative endonuclease [Aequorivita sublithincola DSM 14238]|uniref:Putative endonuclease n=1 Tax=Aequorivita sublithincola (strain DSM 14238 / LMG 21431 / ACAM 643 / 9-3) TaxID=746697 RepID=I3YZY9_AEQSU|nr:putative endonuclease [Aequorivita sublithincola DSM 14238]
MGIFPTKGIIPTFTGMIFIYIQTFKINKKQEIPFQIMVAENNFESRFFTIRPEISIPNKVYKICGLDRLASLSSPPFCDVADELIEIFQERQLVFLDRNQFYLLKHQFKTIGYNFNCNPKVVLHSKKPEELEAIFSEENLAIVSSETFAHNMIEFMRNSISEKEGFKKIEKVFRNNPLQELISNFKMRSGVYFFLDENETVIYVGKAKNVRKRLQSHFSSQTIASNIDYTKVEDIQVEYTGSDIIAQLVESENIKNLKPIYNTQQVLDPAPYIISTGKTANGILKLQITRKEIQNNLPEKYFNRESVKKVLIRFCKSNNLCRKHCGIERVKGQCSKVTKLHLDCVCSGGETIETYNLRFQSALEAFEKTKERYIYKLKGRSATEDAFVYMVNGIYEGYGFIAKEEQSNTINDILGYLIPQKNNYDTSRIVSGLSKKISKENIFRLAED